MKRLLIILLFLPILAFSQVKVGGTLERNHPLDKYPVVDVTDVKGAFMIVPDTNFMLDYPTTDTVRGLPTERRTEGMIVYVQDISYYYKLSGGLSNSFWTRVYIEGSDDTGDSNSVYRINTDRPTKYIGDGVTLGNPSMRIDSAISLLLYAESGPGAAISGNPASPLEKGQAANVTLSWTATLNGTTPISAITVAGESITPTGATQSGTKAVVTSANTTYTISVVAGDKSASASRAYVLLNRVYAGMVVAATSPLDYDWVEPNGNTASPYYQILDTDITEPTKFPYRTLSSSYTTDWISLTNSGPRRLVVVAPTSFGEPEISIDGSFYSGMTLQKRWDFINDYGYEESFSMYVLFTEQNRNPFVFKIRKVN